MATAKNRSHVSPSPTRTSIKEANDHLQLLHQKVIELEKTVQDQTEALMRKDESMQIKLKELSVSKDVEIEELTKNVAVTLERNKSLEILLREKDSQIEQLSEKCAMVEEISSYAPAVERLLGTLKKLPPGGVGSNNSVLVSRSGGSSSSSRPKFRSSNRNKRNSIIADESGGPADLRIGRSFKINSNFSMSEDEAENGQL